MIEYFSQPLLYTFNSSNLFFMGFQHCPCRSFNPVLMADIHSIQVRIK